MRENGEIGKNQSIMQELSFNKLALFIDIKYI